MNDASLIDATAVRLRGWRMLKDRMARYGVALGGISVIVAIVLIFFFLLLVVFPLFNSAKIQDGAVYATPGDGKTLYLEMEEQVEVALRVSDDGHIYYFSTKDGAPISTQALPLGETTIGAFASGAPGSGYLGFALSDGRLLLARQKYRVTYPDGVRMITPELTFPLGEEPLELLAGQTAKVLAFHVGEEQVSAAATAGDGKVTLVNWSKEESMLGDGVTLNEEARTTLPLPQHRADYLVIDTAEQWLYAATEEGELSLFDIRHKDDPSLLQQIDVVGNGGKLTSLRMLLGGISLLAGDSRGTITQWFPVRDADNRYELKRVRDFSDQHAPITAIAAEPRRKGFLAVDDQGNVGLYHTTAHRTLRVQAIASGPLARLTVSPRADALLAEDLDGKLHFWRVHNEHPEVSWSSLWGEVWYESYAEPAYVWQSSAATNDFEPKFSLVPISFGTLKAAFYAMIIAAPLSIMGALFTAYFMSPRMRTLVKPTIEIMEAMPTVILGFLAGLWLAPVAEENLPGIVALFLLVPVGIITAAYGWQRLPQRIRHAVPDGWEAALLIPVIVLVGWVSITLSHPLELWLFDGNIRGWLTNDLGIPFDQRNSLVVGMTMGFAVIPTIFSIAEDAIFGVPKHLSAGSLALGATPWQTVWRVVLLTASPGIFSAVMIGFGRAVGETMIVLMATGNTPVMDMSIFQGMRTLAANIAVEMPESEVNSSHYRVLFLAGLVLFLFTFVFNTTAEIVRQRLRRKYATL